jgi:hypothetical protein
MFLSAKALPAHLILLVSCPLVLAAVGCSDKRRVVDSVEAGETAGSAAGSAAGRAGGHAGASGAAGAGRSQADAPAGSPNVMAAADSGDSASEDNLPAADASTEGNYGWVKFEHTPFGEGRTPNSELRRQIKLTMLGETTMTGNAYVMRQSLVTPYVDVAFVISNSNPDLRCFVKAESVLWKTADGTVIPGDEHQMTYISGSVGNSNDSPTTTCLGPGEKGYFLEIQATQDGMDSLFETLAEIELTISYSSSSFERPGYRVLPTTWQGSKDKLTVTFKNMGVQPAPIELRQGEFILTDGEGLPLTWGFLDVETGLIALGSGEKLVMTSDIYYDGKASNMLVSFGY